MSTTYQSRPVFDFRINWADQPEPSFSYDLRQHSNDWGPLRFLSLQRFIVRGWKFGLNLNSIAEIIAFETFCDVTKGRLNGFWFPAPNNLATIVSGTGDQLVIEDIKLRDTWDAGAPLHVWITRPGETPQAFAIDDVVAGDPGEEIVTLSSSLAADIDATWRAQRLLYARFASDEEKADWLEDGRQRRQITVVELPQEYAAAETGLLKVYFYEFSYVAPGGTLDPLKAWYYTSFQADVSSTYGGTIASQAHTSIPISHGSLRMSTENPVIETTLTDIVYDATGPWSRQREHGFPTLWVRIRSASYAAPNTTTLLFTGEVRKFKKKGAKLTAPCVGGLNAAHMRLPISKRGSVCRLQVFGTTCKLSDTAHKVTATVSAVSGLSLTLAAAGFTGKAANWYARGKLQTGGGKDLRYGTALRSTAESGGEITLLLAFALNVSVSDTVLVWPGCDGIKETCQDKFDNYGNFDGHPLVPLKNSSTDLLSTPVAAPNKK